jgi:signal recognition particle subunit SRP54
MKKMGKGGMMKQALRQMMGKGGPSAEDMAAAQAELAKGGMPKLPAGGLGGFPGMGGGGLKLPPGLSGFGRKK